METLIKKYKSFSEKDTAKIAVDLLKLLQQKKTTHVILLDGNLGGGKTFLTQSLGKGLGIKEIINSPTFNLMKLYKIKNKDLKFKQLVHIDAYRLTDYSELLALGLDEYLEDERLLIVIEWPKNIIDYLKKEKINYYYIEFQILSSEERIIKIYEKIFKQC